MAVDKLFIGCDVIFHIPHTRLFRTFHSKTFQNVLETSPNFCQIWLHDDTKIYGQFSLAINSKIW